MCTGIPHRGMQVAYVARLISMRRVRDGRCLNKDPRHLARIVLGEVYGEDVSFILNCLKGSLGVHFSIGGWIELHRRKCSLGFNQFSLYPISIHALSPGTRLPGLLSS